MNPPPDASPQCGRRRALVLFVNASVAFIGGGLTALLGAFGLRPAPPPAERWVSAGTTADLRPNIPVARVVTASRLDGWYRERARTTVFLLWDGDRSVRALSATCTHLGCQVAWDPAAAHFRCPCHGGVFDGEGRVVSGPPPRALETLPARIDPADASVRVRV